MSLTVALSILWLLLSGYWDVPLLLSLGVVSVLLSVLLTWRMGALDEEGHPVRQAFRALTYWPWLLKEIAMANVDVAKAILGIGGARIDPVVFEVQASQVSPVGRVLYANSITLTPGTITTVLDGDRLTIHAVTAGAVDGLAGGEMDRRARAVEGLS